MHHRRLEALAEGQKLTMPPSASRAAQDRYSAVDVEQCGQSLEILARRCPLRVGRQHSHELGHSRAGRWLQGDVAGDHDNRDASLSDCFTDRDLERAGHLIGPGHECAIVAAILEQDFGMRFLKIISTDLGRWDLCGNGKHRYPRAVAIEQSVDEMEIAGSAAAGANCKLACQMGLGTGREGCHLLMPDMHPVDLALAPERIGQAVQAVADNAINSLDAGRDEDLRKLIGYCFCHSIFSDLRASTRWANCHGEREFRAKFRLRLNPDRFKHSGERSFLLAARPGSKSWDRPCSPRLSCSERNEGIFPRSTYWTAGISIGAINAAIIAGNPPEARVDALRRFCRLITAPSVSSSGWLAH